MNIITLANCTTSSKTATQTVVLSSTPMGNPPYIVVFKKGPTILAIFTDVPENTTKTYQYTLTGADVGTPIFSVDVTDSCSTGRRMYTEVCGTVTVIASICSWISNLGGPSMITVVKIMSLYDAYLGFLTLDFVPTVPQILGCEDYFLGFTGAGNSGTGCNY